MTKIYLVSSFMCDEFGRMIPASRKVFEVFTNKRLAAKCVDRMNEDWCSCFESGNFNGVKWYAIQHYFISHEDYSKRLPF